MTATTEASRYTIATFAARDQLGTISFVDKLPTTYRLIDTQDDNSVIMQSADDIEVYDRLAELRAAEKAQSRAAAKDAARAAVLEAKRLRALELGRAIRAGAQQVRITVRPWAGNIPWLCERYKSLTGRDLDTTYRDGFRPHVVCPWVGENAERNKRIFGRKVKWNITYFGADGTAREYRPGQAEEAERLLALGYDLGLNYLSEQDRV